MYHIEHPLSHPHSLPTHHVGNGRVQTRVLVWVWNRIRWRHPLISGFMLENSRTVGRSVFRPVGGPNVVGLFELGLGLGCVDEKEKKKVGGVV